MNNQNSEFQVIANILEYEPEMYRAIGAQCDREEQERIKQFPLKYKDIQVRQILGAENYKEPDLYEEEMSLTFHQLILIDCPVKGASESLELMEFMTFIESDDLWEHYDLAMNYWKHYYLEEYLNGIKANMNQPSQNTGIDASPLVLEPQIGFKHLSLLTDLIPTTSGLDTNKILSVIENAVALYFAMADVQNIRQFSSVLFLYIKTYVGESMTKNIMTVLSKMLECDILEPQGSEMPSWFCMIAEAKKDWSKVVNSPLFKHFSTILSLATALGMCDLSHIPFSVAGFENFMYGSRKKQVVSADLIEATINTVMYFIEGGYRFMQTGELLFFMNTEDEAERIENLYFEVMDLAPFMKAGNLLSKKGVSENDFDYKITEAISAVDSLYKAANGTWEKKILFERLTQLRKVHAEFVSVRVDGKLRHAPFAIYIEGPSGVGKSTVSALLMRTVLMANGYDASDDRLITLNEADKYMSTYRSHINGVFIDDLGNTQAAFVEKSPVERVIEMVNNVPAYANMAEAELKGKVSIEPHCLIGTSNVPVSSLARQYSNEPYSIVRRFPLQLYVTVKDEFAMADGRLDSTLVAKYYGGQIPVIPDLWNIEVYEPYEDRNNMYRKKIGTYSIDKILKMSVNMSTNHFCAQESVVEYASNLNQKLHICEKCKLPAQICECDVELEQQNAITASTPQILLDFRSSPYLNVINYLPEYVINSYLFKCYIMYSRVMNKYVSNLNSYFYIGMIMFLICMILSFYMALVFMFMYLLFMFGQMYIIYVSEFNNLVRQRGVFPKIVRDMRDHSVKTLIGCSAVVGLLYTALKIYRKTRILELHGNLTPTSEKDIEERDAEPNPWLSVDVSEIPVADVCRTTSRQDLENKVFSNLHYMEIKTDRGKKYCNAFMVKSNLVIIPTHMLTLEHETATFYRKAAGTNGANFRAILSPEYTYSVPNTDLSVVWIPNTWSVKDLSEYLPLDHSRTHAAVMIYKTKDGEKEQHLARLQKDNVRTAAAQFAGYTYILRTGTRKGLCMGTWVSDTKHPFISSFHLGGLGNMGGSGILTQAMLAQAEKNLRSRDGVLLAKSAGTLMTKQYGVDFFESNAVHQKSPTRFLSGETNIDVYGSVIGRVKAHSSVIPTVISPYVSTICKVENKWGPPRFNSPSWKPWQVSLEHSSKPSIGIEADLVNWALEDYARPLKQIFKQPMITKDVRPLTEMETVCGRDGVRFIDKMKPSTSLGYPLSGPKSQYLEQLDCDEYDDFASPMKLDAKFWDEAYRMETEYLAGRRAYPIFKASLKDEPTKLSKDKVRVFQAAPIALQLLARKYFLPVVRVLSLYPLESECAVGINAQGPEWDQLAKHVKRYGHNRILAGDYSKYDLRMPCQLISVAFRFLIDMAKISGNYTDKDISIMEGVATDISQPMMAYNGDLIQHVGSNPSGQNLTVYINSIVNALLFRCAFRHICRSRVQNVSFREVCSLITYGDDAKSSVREGWDEFNHLAVADFLSQRDMKFTMPDKESEPTPYMTDDKADLLKRKNIYNSEVDLIFGALDEDSIFKSLHSVLESKAISRKEQAAINIDGALREWFAYGRTKYEWRRKEMQQVAELAELSNWCTLLDTSYDEMLDAFCAKYGVTRK